MIKYFFLIVFLLLLTLYFYINRGVNLYKLDYKTMHWSEIDSDIQEKLMRDGGIIDADKNIMLPVTSTKIDYIYPGKSFLL